MGNERRPTWLQRVVPIGKAVLDLNLPTEQCSSPLISTVLFAPALPIHITLSVPITHVERLGASTILALSLGIVISTIASLFGSFRLENSMSTSLREVPIGNGPLPLSHAPGCRSSFFLLLPAHFFHPSNDFKRLRQLLT